MDTCSSAKIKIMLKHLLLSLYLTCCIGLYLPAQEYTALDAESRSIPFPDAEDVPMLAANLTDGLGTEKEKVRAIYVWLTDKIRYDVRTAFDEDAEAEEVVAKQQPQVVLKSKKAVCEGYANLFCELCDAAGLKSIKVTGMVKNHHGRIPRIGHAWNLVRADSVWGLIDATWGAGNVDDEAGEFTPQFNPEFFFADPEKMILDHLPYDPLYQLRSRPLTLQEFRMKPEERAALPATKPDPHFTHFTDSLNTLVTQDSNTQFLHSILRTLRYDPGSNRARYFLSRHLCNESVRIYNEYVSEQNALAAKRIPVSKDKLKVFDEYISAALERARQALAEAERVAAGDRYWTGSGTVKRRAKEMQRACLDAKKRNDDLLKRM